MSDKKCNARKQLEKSPDSPVQRTDPESLQGKRHIEMTVDEFVKALNAFARSEVERYLEKNLITAFDRATEAHKKCVENRASYAHKCAFQEALITNIDSYPTKSAAIRDLQVKPDFQDYNYTTLRRWADEVWPKPTNVGRPRKSVS